MFELSSSRVGKGLFEFELDKEPPKWLAWAIRLGPIRGRLTAFVLICGSALLKFYNQPLKFFVEQGWADPTQFSLFSAQSLQTIFTWLLTVAGFTVFLFMVFLRKERMLLTFDRPHKELRFLHIPMGNKNPPREGLIPFKEINAIEVFGPDRSPKSDYGYMTLHFKNRPKSDPYQTVSFKLLSDDQRQIYPSNIGELVDIEPTGDWTEAAES